jgi:hypothetical protein
MPNAGGNKIPAIRQPGHRMAAGIDPEDAPCLTSMASLRILPFSSGKVSGAGAVPAFRDTSEFS